MLTREPGATDRELLDHFVHDQDSGAFHNLVVRHGSSVHRVCKGILNDPHEAEDVFQATFLVLARRAPEIRDPDALGGWLRGVASRIALRSRKRTARRRETEKAHAAFSRDQTVSTSTDGHFDLRELVGEELNRLPDDYRQPIVLCYLDGLTHQEAARQLNWPVGTVKVRLVRGRRMLRERLNRRGVALGAGLLVLLTPMRRASAVNEPLVESTVRAMVLEMSGRRRALKSEYAEVTALADATFGMSALRGSALLWAGLAVAIASVIFSVPVARAFNRAPLSEVQASALPFNLTDVLNVECR